MTFHCFFEQSGTFKNEFRKLGYEAYDYDILNDFGETDYVIDLFAEIEKAYGGGSSVFDSIGKEDQIIAFFPCVRFENQIMLSFRGQAYQMSDWDMKKKMEKVGVVLIQQEYKILSSDLVVTKKNKIGG